MKIHLLSDLHMEFRALQLAPQQTDVVFLAVDIHKKLNGIEWASKTFPDRPVVYVAGNHEFYGSQGVRELDKLRARHRNKRPLPRERGCGD